MGIPDKLTCGQQGDGQLNTGKMVGSSRLSLQCLLHQRSNSTGQDSLNTATVPFQITGGGQPPQFLVAGPDHQFE